MVVVRSFLTQALRDGFFHADMHPGNLFVDSRAGSVRWISGSWGGWIAGMRRFMAETLAGFLARDYLRVAQVHFDYGFVPRTSSCGDLRAGAARGGRTDLRADGASRSRWDGCWSSCLKPRGASICSFSRSWCCCRKPWSWSRAWRARLDPEFDVWEASRPVIERWMLEHLGPEARLKDAAESLTSMGRLAQNIPQLVRDTELIAAQLAEGGIRLHPELVRAIAQSSARNARTIRIALLIAVGALGLLAVGVL